MADQWALSPNHTCVDTALPTYATPLSEGKLFAVCHFHELETRMPEPIDSVIEEWTARLDEAERLAKLTDRPEWDSNFEGAVWDSDGWIADVVGDMNAHIALHDPSSVLEDIGRKRRIIEQYRSVVDAADYQPDGESALMSDGELRALEAAIRTLAGATEETT